MRAGCRFRGISGCAGFSAPHHHDRAVRGRRHLGCDRACGARRTDGYTFAIGNAGTNAAVYTIYPKLPFTPDSFTPIAMVAKTLGIVALRKDFPAATLPEFIAYAKNNPGKINLGHAGIGSSNYLISKSFVQVAGIEVALVGYRGAAPGRTDAIGGQIDGVCDAAASVTHRRSTAS
jgi:tripartite-type tricarboxylate transporter receptor subunit TctC